MAGQGENKKTCHQICGRGCLPKDEYFIIGWPLVLGLSFKLSLHQLNSTQPQNNFGYHTTPNPQPPTQTDLTAASK